MDIEGTYTLQAAPGEVWQCLMDAQTLLHTVPGLERLEAQDGHKSAFDMHIKQAPLRGHYQGQVTVDEAEYPLFYRLTVECEGLQSKIQGVWNIHLNAHNENTVVGYGGTLNLGRVGSLLPATLVKGALKALTQQFFTALAEQLRTTTPAIPLTDTTDESDALWSSPDTPVTISPASGLLYRLVHLARLGNHDPVQETLWVTRLRRIGAISALLLLVWVGTRLPRRLFTHE